MWELERAKHFETHVTDIRRLNRADRAEMVRRAETGEMVYLDANEDFRAELQRNFPTREDENQKFMEWLLSGEDEKSLPHDTREARLKALSDQYR